MALSGKLSLALLPLNLKAASSYALAAASAVLNVPNQTLAVVLCESFIFADHLPNGVCLTPMAEGRQQVYDIFWGTLSFAMLPLNLAATASAVSNVPTQTLICVCGSFISAIHLPDDFCLALYLLLSLVSSPDISTSTKPGGSGRGCSGEELVIGLSRVTWEKVDVSFHKSKLKFAAHSIIQVKEHHMHTEGGGGGCRFEVKMGGGGL
ncbi:unnamed protein product [Fraxinus pennsylvanica]|uniref:Uncharacterized protein n=1 Tax=Fraxinus pennsylvanica TaxID=56036 RepID=A0AAD2DXQ3_9LAMI|nr:unnamed protein product [Fraxinus pennsylvanica]